MLPPHWENGLPMSIGAADGGSQRSACQRKIELLNSCGATPMIVKTRSFTRSDRPIAAESAASLSRQNECEMTTTEAAFAESDALNNRPSSGRTASVEK